MMQGVVKNNCVLYINCHYAELILESTIYVYIYSYYLSVLNTEMAVKVLPFGKHQPVCHAILNTVQCSYNAVNFHPNPHEIHPIAGPLWRGMRCILWFQTVIYTLPHSLQWCMRYHIILDHVIPALTTAMYAMSYYTGTCYNGTRLYHGFWWYQQLWCWSGYPGTFQICHQKG